MMVRLQSKCNFVVSMFYSDGGLRDVSVRRHSGATRGGSEVVVTHMDCVLVRLGKTNGEMLMPTPPHPSPEGGGVLSGPASPLPLPNRIPRSCASSPRA